jgi:hypothetical protein
MINLVKVYKNFIGHVNKIMEIYVIILYNFNYLMTIFFITEFIVIGGCIGFLTGLLGIGGGFILVPVLTLIGIPYNIAVGTSLCQITISSISGTINHLRQKHVDVKLGLLLLCGSIPGAELGAQSLELLKKTGIMDVWMSSIFLVLLVTVSVLMYRDACRCSDDDKSGDVIIKDLAWYKTRICLTGLRPSGFVVVDGYHINSINIVYVLVAGSVVGFFSGLLGIGGGFVLSPILILVFKLPAAIVVGTSLFQMIFTALYGSISHAAKGNIDYYIAVFLIIGAVVGTQAGSVLTHKIRGKKIRYALCTVTGIAAISVLYQLIR